MIQDIKQAAKDRMQKSIDALKVELSKIRTGRAHPSLLEGVMVDYYGTLTPLKQCANVASEDSRTLTVTPWDKSMVKNIEKAILTSNLGLNPMSAGTVIRVPMPALTEARRKELVKVVKQEAEAGRVAVRNWRREANADCKELLKEKEISEDDSRRAEEEIQKLTDKYIADVDKILKDKEAELMEV